MEKDGEMRNIYRVPKKQWRKWSEVGRHVFNELYKAMTQNPELYWHPMAERVKPRMWKVTAWNAAWIAADATRSV